MDSDLPHILVVDDDVRLRELLRKYLSENGFFVVTASDAADARGKLENLAFDLIVLDLMMPGETGLDFTKSFRATSNVPILMLTAMGGPGDRIEGLEKGADDYLAKPFEPRELVLRIHSILRRLPRRPEIPPEVRLGRVTFDLARDELRRDGVPVHLTEVEAALLRKLAEKPGSILSREELSLNTGAGRRAVDVQVTRLRRKIEQDPKLPRYLQTVRGKGYVLWPD